MQFDERLNLKAKVILSFPDLKKDFCTLSEHLKISKQEHIFARNKAKHGLSKRKCKTKLRIFFLLFEFQLMPLKIITKHSYTFLSNNLTYKRAKLVSFAEN